MKFKINIQKNPSLKPHPKDDELGFGKIFTDHMFLMDYQAGKGWYNPRVEPYATFSLDPSTMVLHYGQAIFEGLKAFRSQSDEILLFRPKQYMARFNRSATKLCIPLVDEAFLLEALITLIGLESSWVPKKAGTSLYIRPTIIATDPYLGVRPSETYRLFIILSPVGAYYPEGFNPVKIMVSDEFVRAVKGGLGEAKTPANYAASLFAGEQAKKKGFTQVLWLDGIERKYIDEVGTMNIFFLLKDELVTPPLEGAVLGGVTRDSVIQLARHWGLNVKERRISIQEVMGAAEKGTLKEVFGSGTAAVISPVGELAYQEKKVIINEGKVGELANRLYEEINAYQYGEKKDPFGWIMTACKG
ncbi:MAG: branched-chain amino acid aminotransferase [Candidatus Tectomicrobia bacterium]|uniref:Branched-chain-amino-acid aminotransferase n=1 Tax=Tectimicrobiota bacterium TaxID=2528274 RepID=A0A933GMV2_UNCTE|nr:branched-chain amino acid aminotransferase [Candidatus Tectomicrobia bacterium]